MDLKALKADVIELTQELIQKAGLRPGDLFVLGLSTSEVKGKTIGKESSIEIGRTLVESVLSCLKAEGIHLAVQCCEHLNRALVLERDVLKSKGLSEVTVKPALHAGGAGSVAAWELFYEPAVVEHLVAKAGLDIGDTAIGMHVAHVQVPIRLKKKTLGEAHVTALGSRPKLIGGPRAEYPEN